MNDSERDALLVRIDTRQETMANDISSLKKALYGDDGQGGVCGRVSRLESFQASLIGIAAALSVALTIAGNWVWGKLVGGT